MGSPAALASLTGSLIDRGAARIRVDRALAPSVPAQAHCADTPLFCAKGFAAASALEASSLPAKRPRLWLRLSAAERRRINVAAAFLGKSTADFLRDALAAFANNLTPFPPAPEGARRTPVPCHEPRVKLAFRVDAGLRAEAHSAAACRGESVQTFLTAAIDAHLARLHGAEENSNLRQLLDAFDAVTAERAAESRSAEVIDFPVRRRAPISAFAQRRHAAG